MNPPTKGIEWKERPAVCDADYNRFFRICMGFKLPDIEFFHGGWTIVFTIFNNLFMSLQLFGYEYSQSESNHINLLD